MGPLLSRPSPPWHSLIRSSHLPSTRKDHRFPTPQWYGTTKLVAVGKEMSLSLSEVVSDFADAFKAVDETRPQGSSRARTYRPGIGPLKEADAVNRALQHLKEGTRSTRYRDASPKQYPNSRQQCDLVIPEEWANEFKLLRPFGDNGAQAEHWSENALHPYPGNVSSIGDAIKLIESGFPERKAIVIFGYEHSPPLIDITIAIESFEAIAKQVVGVELDARRSAQFGPPDAPRASTRQGVRVASIRIDHESG